VRRLRPGVAAVHDTVAPYRADWERESTAALEGSGPLWLVLGDSTAQGIGASAPQRGYVGQLRRRLEARDGRAWRVLNVSTSGARLRDVATAQLPRLDDLRGRAALVTCAAGANDVVWPRRMARVRDNLRRVVERLPAGGVIATLPKGLDGRRTAVLNEDIWALAAPAGLLVADVWAHTGPPWAHKVAVDHFHPNERGYEDWAAAFAEALRLGGA
jgi:lysophospholipase L1-like esterase